MRPLTTKQKRFVENHVIKGMSIAESVRRAGYNVTSHRSEDYGSLGCRMLKTERVRKEYNRLREKAFAQDALTFAEKRAFLARAVRTSVDQVGASSDLAQEVVEEVDQEGRVKRKIKVVDKLRALELDNKMSGDNFADRSPQAQNPFMLIVSLGKTAGNTSLLDDARQAASVGSLPHPSVVIDAEVVPDEAMP
jgi:hypothetical protein